MADDERIAALRALTASVRDVVEATIRTGLDPGALRPLSDAAAALAARLGEVVDDDPRAARSHGPGLRDPGALYATNPALGSCNPIAPVVTIERCEAGSVSGTVRFGMAHIGPPGLAHGGIVAAVLDQVLGLAAQSAGHRGMTVELQVRYRRGTPLGAVLPLSASLVDASGRRSRARGEIRDGEGRISAEAEAIFVAPAG